MRSVEAAQQYSWHSHTPSNSDTFWQYEWQRALYFQVDGIQLMRRGDVRRELNTTSGLLYKLHRAVYVSRRVLCTHLIVTNFKVFFLLFRCNTVRGIRSPQLRHSVRFSRSVQV